MTAGYLPTWIDNGPCVDQPELMYPETPRQLSRARAVCRRCPVLPKCKAWVTSLPHQADPGGVIAGMTFEERSHPDLAQPGVKTCTKCRRELPFSEFSLQDGVRPKAHCKECMRDYDAARRAKEGT